MLAQVLMLLGAVASPAGINAQETPINVRTLADRQISQLPGGALVWRLERFPTKAGAEAAALPTSLVAELGGWAYLATLVGGPPGGGLSRGTRLAEIGPLAPPAAPQYLLRIAELSGPPGSKSPIHSHPGAESYFVIGGQLEVRSASGVTILGPGQHFIGVENGTAVQVSSVGREGLLALVLFAVDAEKPLTSPATFPGAPPLGELGSAIVWMMGAAIAGTLTFVAVRRWRSTKLQG